MKVSIIIPNYNHAKYLTQRFESVLKQTYTNFEVIILDDNSQDNSKEIINNYKNHPKVSHIIFNEHNSGSTFMQWNKGIELANGDLIWIAESDDWCEPAFLENLIAPFLEDPNIVIAYCSSLNIRDNEIESMSLSSNTFALTTKGENWRYLNLMDKLSISNASAAVFKKEAVIAYNFDNIINFKLIGDRMFWYQLAQNGHIFSSAKFLNYCRRHKKNVTEIKNKEGIGFLEYLHFLTTIKQDACFNQEVSFYVRTKILNSFLYMEQNSGFLDIEVRNKVFAALNNFMPEFNNLYRKALIKQKLSKVKDKLISFLPGKH